ncbi:NitT/TauT family transport system substrate-binding protein [Mobilisporobacter senegalensis]|uniref:NitT/TauT family transport system substrate-binding protein n=1 Tax=Mobilisporobacter senegalensis TaxID=1329262 RepID=A0A3N1XJS8_9FIRM|nr:ABC transporter substrate-binding protein [Mobilisporobacter senegalensis]ROR25312.1 NitT/TauT family transport system substrate-binding protein [Mobilisporobacter senegalensis]
MKKVLSLALVLTMTASMLIGCGGKKEEAETAPVKEETTNTDTANDAAAEEITLNVAYMPNYASLCTVVAGMKKGYFEEQGIKVNLVEFADGPTIISAMESGSIDVGYIGPGAHKLAIQGKADIFAISHYGNADEVIGNTDKGVSKIEDLAGKTIAMASGTTSETILDLTLKQAGLTRDDVKVMDMDASAIVTAMLSGSVDAAATWSPNTFAIKKELGDKAVMLSNNKTFIDIFPSIASWISNPGYAEKNPDILLRFTKALYKAMDYRTENPEEVAGWVAEQTALDKNAVLDQIYDGDWTTAAQVISSIEDGTMEEYYKAQQQNFIDSGAVTEEVAVSDYVSFQNMLDAAK